MRISCFTDSWKKRFSTVAIIAGGMAHFQPAIGAETLTCAEQAKRSFAEVFLMPRPQHFTMSPQDQKDQEQVRIDPRKGMSTVEVQAELSLRQWTSAKWENIPSAAAPKIAKMAELARTQRDAGLKLYVKSKNSAANRNLTADEKRHLGSQISAVLLLDEGSKALSQFSNCLAASSSNRK